MSVMGLSTVEGCFVSPLDPLELQQPVSCHLKDLEVSVTVSGLEGINAAGPTAPSCSPALGF